MRFTVVYGPAYLDRVIRVDGPLSSNGRIDGSMDGHLEATDTMPKLKDRAGATIWLKGPRFRDRPLGTVLVDGLFGGGPAHDVTLNVLADVDDLGGMGAGYAKAFDGRLVSALGPDDDPVAMRISALLSEQGVAHQPIRVRDQASDWSLIVSSGPFGDKLAVGFRGCHAAVKSLDVAAESKCDLLVVASLPNRLIADALCRQARVRFLAPAMRNVKDVDVPLAHMAGKFDILALNRAEWDAIPDPMPIVDKTPIVLVTDGPHGGCVRYWEADGTARAEQFPVFPRNRPPRDTNRAGEAFASTFVATLLDAGWRPGPSDADLIRLAVLRGSAAAALVLDREEFGFATRQQIDSAIAKGVVV